MFFFCQSNARSMADCVLLFSVTVCVCLSVCLSVTDCLSVCCLSVTVCLACV